MRTRVLRVLALSVIVPVSLLLLAGERPDPATGPAVPPPPAGFEPAPGVPSVPRPLPPQPLPPAVAAQGVAPRDLSRLGPLQKQMLLASQRGSDWLFRMNGLKGRFTPGLLPALKTELEGDSFLRQAGAAASLARAARYTGEERFAVRATQAILALLDETTVDPRTPGVRFPAAPPAALNRLGAAGALVVAINELPAPQADLLVKSDELCAFLRRCARPDGSLALVEGTDAKADDEESVQAYPGLALQGLTRSQRHRQAPWKDEVVGKAADYYAGWWAAHKSTALACGQCGAWAEAFVRTKDKRFAALATDMADWLCGLQYGQIDPRRLIWYGGFMGFAEGRPVESVPTIAGAACADALAEACRVAREQGDLARHQRYTETLERALQFLTTLQYTEANTNHFQEWYRPRLVGGFHASHQDGNLRIDYTQQAVAALLGYLEHVAR